MYRPSRGVGFMETGSGMPACSSMPAVSSTFQGPFACEGPQSDVPRFDAQGQPVTQGALDAVWSYVLAMNPGARANSGGSFSDFVNQNAKLIGIGAGAFLLALMFSRR